MTTLTKTRLGIFLAANGGYYLASVDGNGTHRQPPSWDSQSHYPSIRAAKAARKALEERALDAHLDECGECQTYGRGSCGGAS